MRDGEQLARVVRARDAREHAGAEDAPVDELRRVLEHLAVLAGGRLEEEVLDDGELLRVGERLLFLARLAAVDDRLLGVVVGHVSVRLFGGRGAASEASRVASRVGA